MMDGLKIKQYDLLDLILHLNGMRSNQVLVNQMAYAPLYNRLIRLRCEQVLVDLYTGRHMIRCRPEEVN